jgi:hypothetical protein
MQYDYYQCIRDDNSDKKHSRFFSLRKCWLSSLCGFSLFFYLIIFFAGHWWKQTIISAKNLKSAILREYTYHPEKNNV